AKQFSKASAAGSIVVISILRLPGLISGLFFSKISNWINIKILVRAIPIIYLLSSLVFSSFPSIYSFSMIILMQGLLTGLYWPSDFSLRNDLCHTNLVKFNTSVLRHLSVAQFVSCLAALWFFSPGNEVFG